MSNNTLYRCLFFIQMFSSGQVSAMKVAQLKASYQLLRDTLRRYAVLLGQHSLWPLKTLSSLIPKPVI